MMQRGGSDILACRAYATFIYVSATDLLDRALASPGRLSFRFLHQSFR
jgi:hypothetical protein